MNSTRFAVRVQAALIAGVACYPATAQDVSTMAQNVSSAAEAWYTAIEWSAVLIGVVILAKGFMQLAENAHDPRVGYGSAFAMMIASVGLLYLPSAFSASSVTLYNTDQVFAYAVDDEHYSTAVIHAVIRIVQVIGLIAFVRGWIYLSRAGQGPYRHHSMVARGLFFIVGGVASINILLTARVISSTFGLESPI